MITMATTEAAQSVSGTQKKAKSASKPKKAAAAVSHPKVSNMVLAAITNLKDRGGSSLQAIKKYIASNYKVDSEKLSPFIKKYLKASVAVGSLHQTKGKGASGSFKLSSSAPAKKNVQPKKAIVVKKTEKPKAIAAKKVAKKRIAKPKKAKAPKKEKKARAPKKLKTPKPKKTAKKTSAKK